MSGKVVQITGVSAGYGRENVLAGVSLTVAGGQFCAVLGPNGAGKSTLVRLLSGAIKPREGRVILCGQDVAGLDRRAIARMVAVVPQAVEVAFGFSVREVVMMGRAPHQGAWMRASSGDREAVDRAMEACELHGLAARPVAALSGGEQKRVAIARALAQEAPLLLLDEAGAHLDVRHTIAVHELVRRELSRRELCCVAVLHDLNAAARYADRIALLKAGQIVAEGTVPEVMTYRRLREVFETDLYVGVNEIDNTRYFLPFLPSPPGSPGGPAT
jgi:iron complex transport system ATP-binding protein